MKQLLQYWIKLAHLRDRYGLPVDLMYCHLRNMNALPCVRENGTTRSVTEEEFQQGIKDCISLLQGRSPHGMDLSDEDMRYLQEQVA